MQALGSSLPVSWVMCTQVSQLEWAEQHMEQLVIRRRVMEGRGRGRGQAIYEGVSTQTRKLGKFKLYFKIIIGIVEFYKYCMRSII